MSEFIKLGVNLFNKNEISSIGYDAKFDGVEIDHILKIKYKKLFRRSETIHCNSKEEVENILKDAYTSLNLLR